MPWARKDRFSSVEADDGAMALMMEGRIEESARSVTAEEENCSRKEILPRFGIVSLRAPAESSGSGRKLGDVGGRKIMPFDHPVKGLAIDIEQARGRLFVAARVHQHPRDIARLNL